MKSMLSSRHIHISSLCGRKRSVSISMSVVTAALIFVVVLSMGLLSAAQAVVDKNSTGVTSVSRDDSLSSSTPVSRSFGESEPEWSFGDLNVSSDAALFTCVLYPALAITSAMVYDEVYEPRGAFYELFGPRSVQLYLGGQYVPEALTSNSWAIRYARRIRDADNFHDLVRSASKVLPLRHRKSYRYALRDIEEKCMATQTSNGRRSLLSSDEVNSIVEGVLVTLSDVFIGFILYPDTIQTWSENFCENFEDYCFISDYLFISLYLFSEVCVLLNPLLPDKSVCESRVSGAINAIIDSSETYRPYRSALIDRELIERILQL